MNDRDPLETLREQFRTAAVEDARTRSAGRRRRRFSRGGVAAVAVVGVSAGFAVAGGLIGTGEPRRVPPGKVRTDQPARIARVVQTADGGRELPYAVGTYSDTPRDLLCVIGGQARGEQIGEIKDGTFRPYGPGFGGACGTRSEAPFFGDTRVIDGRRVFFGVARKDVRTVRVYTGRRGSPEQRSFATQVGEQGTFLFVLSEQPTVTDARAFDASGARVTE